MDQPRRKPMAPRDIFGLVIVGKRILVEIAALIVGATVIGSFWYFVWGMLHRVDLFERTNTVALVQYALPAVLAIVVVAGVIEKIQMARKALQARKATEEVAEALDDLKTKLPSLNVAAIPAGQLAGQLVGELEAGNVSDEYLVRLVQQRKQQLLIDDDYFRKELSFLIVDYLQPLPRNAKRLLNRFRVNLLIAHGRGLFTSEPRVTTQQIGKWLVLSERWPQLARSLSAAPERMKELEDDARLPSVSSAVQSRSGGVETHEGSTRPRRRPDSFGESIELLAPFYSGDEDLRKFIGSEPSLAGVLPRLVHFGASDVASTPEEGP